MGPLEDDLGPHVDIWGLPSRRSRALDLPLWFVDLSPPLDTTSHGMAWVHVTFSATVLGNLIPPLLVSALTSPLQTFQETVHGK